MAKRALKAMDDLLAEATANQAPMDKSFTSRCLLPTAALCTLFHRFSRCLEQLTHKTEGDIHYLNGRTFALLKTNTDCANKSWLTLIDCVALIAKSLGRCCKSLAKKDSGLGCTSIIYCNVKRNAQQSNSCPTLFVVSRQKV